MELSNHLTVLKRVVNQVVKRSFWVTKIKKKMRTEKQTKALSWIRSRVIMVDVLIVRFKIHFESITERICCWFGWEMLDKEQI